MITFDESLFYAVRSGMAARKFEKNTGKVAPYPKGEELENKAWWAGYTNDLAGWMEIFTQQLGGKSHTKTRSHEEKQSLRLCASAGE